MSEEKRKTRFERLQESIREQSTLRDQYGEDTENWKFYNRDIERMRGEIAKINEDERYGFRSWGTR